MGTRTRRNDIYVPEFGEPGFSWWPEVNRNFELSDLRSDSIVSVEEKGAVTGGIVDCTGAFQEAAAEANGKIFYMPPGIWRLTERIVFPSAGNYGVLGGGVSWNADMIPDFPKGTIVLWDGDPADYIFEMGGSPLYINGVFQEENDWQLNNRMGNFAVHCNAGMLGLLYAHDLDNLACKRILVNGFAKAGVRGAFDLRGTISNARMDRITIYDLPHGYGFRMGDAFVNSEFVQCAVQKTALCYWLGDTLTYERPYPDGMTTFRTCSCEGTVTGSEVPIKFVVDTVNGTHSAGIKALTVSDGSKFAAGDNVFIGRGTGGSDKFEMNYVASIAGNVLNLVHDTEYAHGVGEPIKGGTSMGFHIGGSNAGQSTGITLDGCMINWVGVGIDAHYTSNIDIRAIRVPGKVKTFLYLDDDVNNVNLSMPDIWPGKDSDYKFIQCRSGATGIYDIFWWGRPDRSGITYPFDFNPNTDGDFFFVGSELQKGRVPPEFPKYFRSLTFDNYWGIVLRETENPKGLRYYAGEESVKKLMFGCIADGTPYWNDNIGLPPRMFDAAGAFFGSGTKFVFGYSTLNAGTITVTLVGNAVFNNVNNYSVAVIRSANAHGWRVTRASASQFTIISSDLTDTDLVQWLAFGV